MDEIVSVLGEDHLQVCVNIAACCVGLGVHSVLIDVVLVVCNVLALVSSFFSPPPSGPSPAAQLN